MSCRRSRACAFALALAVAGLAACAKPGAPPSTSERGGLGGVFLADAVDPVLLVEGAEVFRDRCSPCHGDRGYGDGVLADALPIRPRNYHADHFKWGTAPADLVQTIATGRSGVMPPFEGALSEREIWAAAYLVWHLIPEARRERESAAAAP